MWVLAAALGLCLGAAVLPAQADTAPQRVVSMNLCTDQLAMLLAAPGQLVSVSELAVDPMSSIMVEEARAYPTNSGRAEEIFLLKPDLVLAGTFTGRASVSMLQRLGITVASLPPAYSIEDVRQGMLEMGRLLHREPQAEEMLAAFDARLATLREDVVHRPTAATYAASGYTTGNRSLSSEIIEAAGLHNLALELGMEQGGFLPLETLVMAAPDLVLTGIPYPGASRAEEILSHPALLSLQGGRGAIEDRDWVCGLPATLDAVERLVKTRRELEPAQ